MLSKKSNESSTSDADADEKKALLIKYKELLEERDVIKKHMQDASNYNIDLKKKKEEMEKKIKGKKNCSLADYDAVNRIKDQYDRANEVLKNYIDEAKQINYKVLELQSKIGSEALQKAEIQEKKKIQPVCDDPPPSRPTVIYSCYDTGNHWCEQCSKAFSTLGKMMQHLHSPEHLKHLDPFKVLTENETIKETKSTSNTVLQPVRGVEFMKPVFAFYCTLCKITLRNRGFAELHLKGHDHTLNYMNYTKENPNYVKKRELIKTARMAASIKAKREKEFEKRESKLKGKIDAENRVKAKLKEERNLEADYKELDDSCVNETESKKNVKEVCGLKLALLPEKERNKDLKAPPIFIGKAPNYRARTKVNIKKLPEPKKPKLVVKVKEKNTENSVIEKIIEEINDPEHLRASNKIPTEKTVIIHLPVPSKESEKSHVVEPSNALKVEKDISVIPSCQKKVESKNDSTEKSSKEHLIPRCQNEDETKSDATEKSSKKRSRNDDVPLKKSKLSGCQTENEAKLSKEAGEQNFPEKESILGKDNKKPSDLHGPKKGQDQKFPDKELSLKKDDKKKSDNPYEPKTDNPLVDQALKNILYGTKNSGSSDLCGIELPKSPQKSSSPPPKKMKSNHSSPPKKSPGKKGPLTEEEEDFLLLGISKSDLVPLAIPKPPPSVLISPLSDIARKLPPFPPPLSVPPPNLVLQSATVFSSVGVTAANSSNTASHYNSNSTQLQTLGSHSNNSAVVDMDIDDDDDEPELPTNIIVHEPVPVESNAACPASDPKQPSGNLSSERAGWESSNSSSSSGSAQIASTCDGGKSETLSCLDSCSSKQTEEAKTFCESLVNSLVSDEEKQFENDSKTGDISNSFKEIEVPTFDSLHENQSTNLEVAESSSLVLEGKSTAISCLAESECDNELNNQTLHRNSEVSEPLLKSASDSQVIRNKILKDCEQKEKLLDRNSESHEELGSVEAVNNEKMLCQNEKMGSACDSAQTGSEVFVESSDLKQKSLEAVNSEKNSIFPISEIYKSGEDGNLLTMVEPTPNIGPKLQSDCLEETKSSSKTSETTFSANIKNYTEKSVDSQVFPHAIVANEENVNIEDNLSLVEINDAPVSVTNTEIPTLEVVSGAVSQSEGETQEMAVVESDKSNTEAEVSMTEDFPTSIHHLDESNVHITCSMSSSSENSMHVSLDSDPKEKNSQDAQFGISKVGTPELSGLVDFLNTSGSVTMSPSRDDSSSDMKDEFTGNISRNVSKQPLDSEGIAMNLGSETPTSNSMEEIDTSHAEIAVPIDREIRKSEEQCTDSIRDNVESNVLKPVIKVEPYENEEMDVSLTDSSLVTTPSNSCQTVLKSEPKECEKMDTSEKISTECQQQAECAVLETKEGAVRIKTEPEEVPPSVNICDQEGRRLAELELSTKIALASILLPYRLNGSSETTESSRPFNVAEVLSRNRWDLLFASNRHLDIERAVRERTSQLLRSSTTYTQCPAIKLERTFPDFRQGPTDANNSAGCSKRSEEDTPASVLESCSASEPPSNCSASGNSELEKGTETIVGVENHNRDGETPPSRNTNENTLENVLLERNNVDASAPHLERFDSDDDVTFLHSHQSPHLGLFPIPRIFVERFEQALQSVNQRGNSESCSSGNSSERILSELLSQQLTVPPQEPVNTQRRVENPVGAPNIDIKKETDELKEEVYPSVEEQLNPSKASCSSIKIEETKDQQEFQLRKSELSASKGLNQVENTEGISPSVSVPRSDKFNSDDVELVFTKSGQRKNMNEIPVIDIADSETDQSDEENAEGNHSKKGGKKSLKRTSSERSKGKNDSDTDEYEAN